MADFEGLSKTPEHLKIYDLSNNLPNPVEELCRIGDAYLKATGLTPDEAIKRLMAEIRREEVVTPSTPHS